MNGYLNILKPPGMTSSDVVVFLRRTIKPDKIGHAGTLDPDAAGVLPIMLGKATKLFDYLNFGTKEYIAEFTFGTATDTADAGGNKIAHNDRIVSHGEILDALPFFTGTIVQKPPMVSAVNINGKRAYSLARQGAEVELPARRVEIHSFVLVSNPAENRFIFKIECSKGTYIRSLCTDLAGSLGSYAYISFLLRTKSGYFDIRSSIPMSDAVILHQEGLLNRSLIALDEPIHYLPEVRINESDFLRAVNGANIKAPMIFDGAARVYCGSMFLGLGKMSSDGMTMSIYKVLAVQHD